MEVVEKVAEEVAMTEVEERAAAKLEAAGAEAMAGAEEGEEEVRERAAAVVEAMAGATVAAAETRVQEEVERAMAAMGMGEAVAEAKEAPGARAAVEVVAGMVAVVGAAGRVVASSAVEAAMLEETSEEAMGAAGTEAEDWAAEDWAEEVVIPEGASEEAWVEGERAGADLGEGEPREAELAAAWEVVHEAAADWVAEGAAVETAKEAAGVAAAMAATKVVVREAAWAVAVKGAVGRVRARLAALGAAETTVGPGGAGAARAAETSRTAYLIGRNRPQGKVVGVGALGREIHADSTASGEYRVTL